jgi:sulfur-oxidizing protein SoxY
MKREKLKPIAALQITMCLLVAAGLVGAPPGHAAEEDLAWESGQRAHYFGDREIAPGDGVITLETPTRAEDPAVVPITIRAGFAQSPERFIRQITVLIDANPTALVGRFELGPRNGRADLAMRVRVNAYSPIRAIAETNDGSLYMARTFVKASGGCSAPIGTDLEAAMSRIGRIKLDVRQAEKPHEPLQVQLRLSHPNVTGLQMDQLTRLFAPAHFVRKISVSFDGQPVLAAETDISISENPSFRFGFLPDGAGLLEVEVVDSQGQRFTGEFEYPGPGTV